MAVDERRRKALHDALERQLGRDEAATMMELLPPAGWADVATKEDLRQLELRLETRMDALRAELRGEISELRGEIAALRAELRGEISELRGEILGVRGEMGGLAGELKAHTMRTILAVNVPSILGAVALSFTAVKIA